MFHSYKQFHKAKYPISNKRFTWNKSFTIPNGGKLIIVSLIIRLFRRTRYPKINNSFETIIRDTRVVVLWRPHFKAIFEAFALVLNCVPLSFPQRLVSNEFDVNQSPTTKKCEYFPSLFINENLFEVNQPDFVIAINVL